MTIWRFGPHPVPEMYRNFDRSRALGRADLVHHILANVDIDPVSGCWNWQRATRVGYGALKLGGRRGRLEGVHRLAYTLWRGEIPVGWDIDHLCCNRGCCNPEHLEAVTRACNMPIYAIGYAAVVGCGHIEARP